MDPRGIKMGENKQVDNMEYSLELMLQCKYANREEDVAMTNNKRKNNM